VVSNVTATSETLLDALREQARRGPLAVELIVPATAVGGGREGAREQLVAALEGLRAAGIEADGRVGDADPVVAVKEAWDPKRHDEIVVVTLPASVSKWLHAGLPERIARVTGATVTHLALPEPRPAARVVPAPPPHADLGIVLGAIAAAGSTHISEQRVESHAGPPRPR
jgi:hypothetical protein